MKTITIRDYTWKQLTQMKLDLAHDSLDTTIDYMLITISETKGEPSPAETVQGEA